MVVLNNVIKYILNITKGVAGERMLRRLRYMLYHSLLRFRLSRFRRVSGGELIPMITAEVEDIGVFIGEAIATPAFQGGTLLVYIFFIFAQDPFLGAAAISLYPIQGYIIPKLQRRVIILTRERIKNVRMISDRVNESVGAAADIHANDTARFHLSDLSDRLFINYRIRLEIFKRKFMIKFINNFMNQLPPFFFYSVGGVLVINGSLSFGALVAVLAAYKDLASPWKELLNWYQTLANVTVKYETVVENFDVEDAMSPSKISRADEPPPELEDQTLKLRSVTATSGGNQPEVVDVSLELPTGSVLGVYGRDGSGRGELLMALAGLIDPISGRATLGDGRMEDMPYSTLSHYISFVSSDPFVFNDTLRSNVVYGLKTHPQGDGTDDFTDFRRAESELTGNSLLDVTAPWEDLVRAGVDGPDALDARLVELFQLVGLDGDLFRLGLGSHVEPGDQAKFADAILKARGVFMKRAQEDAEWADLIELWDPKAFNHSATIGENVLFGVPVDASRPVWECISDDKVRKALEEAGILSDLMTMGAEVASTMIELFADTGADAGLMGDYSFLAPDDVPLFEQRLRTLKTKGAKGLGTQDIAAFVGLALRIVPARHRIVTIDDEMAQKIVSARGVVHEHLADSPRYSLFDAETYASALSVEENLLFGKARVDRRGSRDKIDAYLRQVVLDLGLRAPISRAGLGFNVGVAGGRLSASQRRRLCLVRALVKRPKILIFDTVADGDPELMERILRTREKGKDTLVVGTTDPQIAKLLDTVAVMREGQLVAKGGWDSVQQMASNGSPDEAEENEEQ
ncbi:ATP-binding cassette domain-containing protein [Acuticoccus sp. MNP-M23]|nr:ATP-binding cassette domain-containing protein [Acuticoccus sp. MNP-M23]WMS45069.1 ATP-binding cassette domain-containing protein [Acuticoccus sp. MNP-M23]